MTQHELEKFDAIVFYFSLLTPAVCLLLQRIEEIMKRTRKSEVEPPSAAPGKWM